jgi:2-oxoglutarate dehydrogenase E2 component (dihydrolipoamide succinyltransferase)
MANIVVPELGESVVEARIAKWLKKPGDHVDVGDALVELETEKIDLEVSAEKGGVLASIARQEGEDVKIGELLAVVDESGTAAAAPAPAAKADAKPAAAEAKPAAKAPAAANGSANGSAGDDLRATPTARRVARDHDVDLESVQGTGSAGRVMKQDVQAAIAPAAAKAAKPAAAPAPAAPAPAAAKAEAKPAGLPAGSRGETRTRMTKRRETIARRLVEAQHNAAMLTTFNEVDMTAVMGLRERQKESFKKRYGMNLGIASFFVKASIAALKAFPQLNAEIQGNEIVNKPYHDIGMAVGAEGGLVVPVLRDAGKMTFAEIEKGIREYAQKASDGTLTLEDLAGGTFTITNGGVFGSLLSTPILNPPQVGILGLHKIQERPVVVNGQVVIRPIMYVALSYDHRIVDGREAVQFLVKIKEFIEDPGHLLLES